MKVFSTLFMSFFLLSLLNAQQTAFQGELISSDPYREDVIKNFKEWDIFQIDADAIDQHLRQQAGWADISLQLADVHLWNLSLQPSGLISTNYQVRVLSDEGEAPWFSAHGAEPYKGYLQGSNLVDVRLTMASEYLYGYVTVSDQERYFIEPLWYYAPDADRDLFIVYNEKDVQPKSGNCGAKERHTHAPQVPEEKLENTPENNTCVILELAIASDGLMFIKYGSVQNVENHTAGVMNNVQGNYDDEFNYNIQFEIVEQFVSTSPANDPWTQSTNAGTLLNSFTNWGPNGFSATHDLGQLWTDRNLDGSTIGIAWLSSVCNSLRYHVCQDFSSNAQFLRVLTAHEIGHNFSAQHDNSGTWIMSPSVNQSTQWSSQSQSSINGFTATRLPPNGCLSFCPPPVPPTPQFSANVTQICQGSMVSFFDQSTNNPVTYAWTFPGGTPSSSTEPSPTITYQNIGVYNVTLTVSNSNGSNSLTKPAYIIVLPTGATDFFFYEDFEDGIGNWSITNPDNGFTWEASTVGGTRSGNGAMRVNNHEYNAVGQRDGMVSPVIDLTGRANVTLQVEYAYRRYSAQFRDSMVVYASSNGGNTYQRIFAATESGTGNFATAPQSTQFFTPNDIADWCYAPPGGFGNACLNLDLSAYDGLPNVRIRIENVNGFGNNMYVDNVRMLSDCFQVDPPVPAFTSSNPNGCVPLLVNFTDQSENNPTFWSWSFPGGIPSSSTQPNPTIGYTQPGVYDVTLVVGNSAGTATIQQLAYVNVEAIPTANFNYTVNGFTVQFNNTTLGTPTSFLWQFGDGNSSNQSDPSHTYAADGAYVVTLTAINACGSQAFNQVVTIITPTVPEFSASPTEGCSPMEVTFSNESSPNVNSFFWEMPGADPAESTEENPTVMYNSAGTYSVTLTTENSLGSNSITKTNYIVVGELPNPDFSVSTNLDTASFTNLSVAADSYLWDFGDGSTSTEESPTHVYDEDGTYTVTLTATNNCGSESITLQVEISTVPVASFSATPQEGCLPLTVQFNDLSSENTESWFWVFDGGTPGSSSEQNPEVTYNAPGTYSVSLTVSNDNGTDILNVNDFITVGAPPSGDINVYTELDSISATSNIAGATSYFWDFGDGNSSTEANATHIYAEDGVYTLNFTASNDCGNLSFSETITIVTPPTAGFAASANEGCTPFTVNFTNQSSSNATSWLWEFDGGVPATSTEQNPEVVYESAGTFSVTLTVSNAAGENTLVQTDLIVVSELPTANFNASINGLDLSTENNSSGAVSYLWDFGDGNTSTEVEPTHQYAGDGVYTITLTASNDCGDADVTQVVTVVTLPAAGFSASNTSGCAPLTVQYTDTSSANTTSWFWTFEGGNPATSDEQNPTVVYNQQGSFDVTLTVSNAAGDDTVSFTDFVVVDDVPATAFTSVVVDLTATFTNASTNANSYFWDFGDGNTSTEENPVHTYAQDGIYTVTLTATNACGDNTTTGTVNLLTPPTAGFSADVNSGCAPLTVTFSDESSSNTMEWLWDFPGGTPSSSTEQNPTVVYNTPGIYPVSLTVSNDGGENTLTLDDFIVVLGTPTAAFDASTNLLDLTLVNNSSNADSYSWDFGDGNTSTEETPAHSYAAEGNYTVVLTATNACGSVTAMQNVEVVLPPTAGFTADPETGCAPLTVQFNDASSSNVTSWEWTFDGGIPATSTEQNPVVVFENPDFYSVTLTVTNSAGSDTQTNNFFISALSQPLAAFDYVLNGLVLNLTNNSQIADSYFWDFGDGNTSTEENPQHIYLEDGTYVVTLTATNQCGDVSTTQTIEVITPPQGGFSSTPTEGCAPFTVQFTDESSSNATSWSWTFEGGTPATSNEQNPAVVYNSPGVYNVMLVVSNAAGQDIVTQTDYVTVGAAPVAGFTALGNGFDMDFTNASMDAVTYLWDFGDGNTNTDENPMHTYAEEGIYTVTLTVDNPCGTDVFTQSVVIATSGPIVLFETSNTEGCAPFAVVFNNLSSANTESFQWLFPGGNPINSTEVNPVVVYGAPGTYSVTLIGSNPLGNDTLVLEDYIVVSEPAVADFNFIVTGATVNFTSTSTGANTYFWDFGNGNTSTEENPSHTYMQTGVFNVTLTVTNPCGSVSITQQVLVEAVLPQAAFDADIKEGCVPLEVQFTDFSSGNPTSWQWLFPGGEPASSAEQNPTVVYNTPGSYSVTLNVGNAAGSNQLIQSSFINVNDVPDATFTYEEITEAVFSFTNTSTGAVSYLWDFGDGNTSTMVNPVHTFTSTGEFLVLLQATNECGTTSITETIEVILISTNDLAIWEYFNLFPNPNDGLFHLVLQGQPITEFPVQLNLYDVLGRRIWFRESNFSSGELRETVQVQNLAKGVYVLEVRAGEQAFIRKVVVK